MDCFLLRTSIKMLHGCIKLSAMQLLSFYASALILNLCSGGQVLPLLFPLLVSLQKPPENISRNSISIIIDIPPPEEQPQPSPIPININNINIIIIISISMEPEPEHIKSNKKISMKLSSKPPELEQQLGPEPEQQGPLLLPPPDPEQHGPGGRDGCGGIGGRQLLLI